MKRFAYIMLIALFSCGVDAAAQKRITESDIRKEYNAARAAHEMGRMFEAGDRYCNVLDYYHKEYGDKSLQYAEIMQSISNYYKDNAMHLSAVMIATNSFKIYAKDYTDGIKRFSVHSGLVDKISKTRPKNVNPHCSPSVS